MNWLDIVVIAILVINIGLGWFRGLIRSVVNIVSIVAGFVCAKMYHMVMYDYLETNFSLLSKIQTGIADTFKNIELPTLSEAQSLSSDQLLTELPESNFISKLVENFIESEGFQSTIESNVSSFSEAFSSWLSDKLLTIMSMVLIFVAVYLGIRIVGYILSKLFELPGLKEVNRLSGLIFGCIKGAFFAMLLVLIVAIMSPIVQDLNLVHTLETSKVAIYFYKYNVLMMIFEGLI